MLQSLAGHRAFVLHRLAPLPNGKTDKIPVDPLTGYNSDAQDSTKWMLPEMAQAFALEYGKGYGVGIVLYEGSELFCIDIDGCIADDGTISQIALDTIARFPGCVVEYSQSGKGLHIFGRYKGVLAPHGSKNTHWHMELYVARRFIALTGRFHTEGNIHTDCTQALAAFAAEYFPKSGGDYAGEWTTEPAKGWDFYTDDAKLIAWALMPGHGTPSQKFGGKASFADLWYGNADALAEFFKSTTGDAYDHSGADQALANALAYWTGNNCERVANLMRQSKLVRAKWDREDYFGGTVAKACTHPGPWPKRPPVDVPLPEQVATPDAPTAPWGVVPPPPAPPPAGVVPPVPDGPPVQPPVGGVGAMIFSSVQRELFKGYVLVNDVMEIVGPNGRAYDKLQFEALPQFSGREYQMKIDGTDPTTSAWECFNQSQVVTFAKVDAMYFEPREACGTIMPKEGLLYVNTYIPLGIRSVPGDVSRFINHVRKLLPDGNDAEILLSFLKFMVQHKGIKAAWCPFIQGVEGNGKSFINATMEYCLGKRYTHYPKASELAGRFNGPFYGKLFIAVNDVKITDDHGAMWETLKPMIDSNQLEIEMKGVDKVTREVCFNFILNSNHQDGIRKTRNDRRIAPFFCAQQQEADLARDGLTTEYFTDLWAWAKGDGWANVLHWLETDPINPEYNPAALAIRAPRTTATEKAIDAGLGGIEQDILEAAAIGAVGFAGGWISSAAVDAMVSKGHARISRNKRKDLMATIGYIPHPALPEGRINAVLPDGTRPRLYVTRNHPSLSVTEPALVRSMYLNAQAPNSV
jgi:hypothetical protein